jgi:hypothetical protein
VQGTVAGDDFVGQVIGGFDAVAGVGHTGYFGKDLFADISNQGRDASHKKPPKKDVGKNDR